jgi:tRNA nucleotidyltransferase/poly(A) polymerase
LPEQVREVFGHRRTIAIGASFGVITVLGPKSAGQIEVATFRHDGTYSDGRHPDQVVFSSPEVDALRRDFTINGMFFDPVADEVIDYVGGQSDLADQVVRAIGDPFARIAEDRLRMLRAVRFASVYGFCIEEETWAAIQQQRAHIKSVSNERITSELEHMLLHPNRCRAMQLLSHSQLLSEVLPEVGRLAVERSEQWVLLLKVLNALQEPTFATVLATLLGCCGTNVATTDIDRVCRRLKISNDVRKATLWMVQNEPQLRIAHQLRFSQFQPLLMYPEIEPAFRLAGAIVEATGDSTLGIEVCRQKLKLPPEQLDPPPLVRGEELGELGAQPGPAYARVLRAVRSAQLDGLVADKAAALSLARDELERA